MASGERNRTQERRRTLIILTAKITEESDMETNIDYDGKKTEPAGLANKEKQTRQDFTEEVLSSKWITQKE